MISGGATSWPATTRPSARPRTSPRRTSRSRSPEEIAAVEYYLEHFVWGKLQRTDKETPYPYGIHGVPNWRDARDPLLRAKNENARLDRMKIWRSYDYPHMVMLYYHMYEIAKKYPAMVHYLDAAGYLERAYQTARAYFIYPYEVLPWYETYKWGCYNELLIPALVETLEKEGLPGEGRLPALGVGEEGQVFRL